MYDFDGVIMDSFGSYLAAYAQMKNTHLNWDYTKLRGLKPLDVIRRFEMGDNPKGSYQTAHSVYEKLKDLIPARSKRVEFMINMGRTTRATEYQFGDFIPGALEILKSFNKAGIIQGICTNSEGQRLPTWLKKKDCMECISAYTSRNDRHEYGIKPGPRILLHLIAQLKKKHNLGPIDKNRVYFCGDNVTDIWAAQNARIKSIAVLSGHGSKLELTRLGADYVINSINELPQISEIKSFIEKGSN